MKVYPEKLAKKEKDEGIDEVELTSTERITRVVALTIAFLAVYFFFFKVLFF